MSDPAKRETDALLRQWRNVYRGGFRIVNMLTTGGVYTQAELLDGCQTLAARPPLQEFLGRLVEQQILEELSPHRYRLRDSKSLAALMRTEKRFAGALGIGHPAPQLGDALGSMSLLELSQVIEPALKLYGHGILASRFGIAGNKLVTLRIMARMPEGVAARVFELGLTARHALALGEAMGDGSGDREALLALVELAHARGFSSPELAEVARQVAAGIPITDAAFSLGLTEPTGSGPTPTPNPAVPDEDPDETPPIEELVAASLKATLAVLRVVSEINKKVTFLTRELGYKEDAGAHTG
jgi:hypothetical protein